MADTDTRDTKERILDAAEHLFAESGFGATSLRGITSEAGVNLAAVNYHFGSKEALVEEVFSRRIAPINRQRLESLDRIEAEGRPSVEEIVEIFVAPPLRMSREWQPGGEVMRMLGHAMSQHDVQEIFVKQFREVFQRFSAALGRALPEVDEPELLWRFLFMIGSMAYTMAMSDEYQHICAGRCGGHDPEATIRRLVPFLAAGLRAAVPATEGKEP